MYRDDLATLYTVSEDSVMETLSQRFSQGNIYTFVGDVLLIVNPFNEYPIYGAEVCFTGDKLSLQRCAFSALYFLFNT
jgi:myosin heavy subunit